MALSLSEQLLSPISANNGVGQWLRYDPIYVKIRDARREENDGMHREAWEGELKRADWQAVEKMAYETTEKQSKDLQLVTWLIEARLHLYGLDVFSQDTEFLLTFIKNFWENCHPQKTEDPNQEFRTHILEAFIRSATETILLEPFAELSPILNQSLNLAKCYENDNLEKMSKQGGSAASSYQKSLADGLVTISRIKNAFSEVDKEKGITRVSQLEVCVKNLQTINLFLNQEIGTEGPNFDSLINHLQELKNLYSLCQKVATPKLTNNPEPEIATIKEPAQEKQEEADSNKKTINNRAEVYQAIRQLSGFLLTLDPHSPSPALLHLIGGWENKTLPQILAELQSTQPETKSLLELLARATQQENKTANTTPKSTDISALSNLAQG